MQARLFRLMDNLPNLLNANHPLFVALAEIQKPRSKFQLENFVIGQHDSDEQKYKQTLLEIQSLIYTIRTVKLELKKQEIEIARLIACGDEIAAIDAQIKMIGMEQTRLVMIGAERELSDLVEIWESFPVKYSYEDLEANQPIYWENRLTRQAQLEAVGKGEVNWSSLDALRQIGIIPNFIEKNSRKEIE